MMLTRRIVACLDVKGARVVKGVRFERLRDAGDPAELACAYERQGADEIVWLDISATAEQRRARAEWLRRTAERLFIPLTVGGGVRSADDVAGLLRAGADKVAINSAAVERESVITEAAARFGSQCVVASIDARRERGEWRVYTRAGSMATGLEAGAWAARCVQLGAGEILLTSIDDDGRREGYALDLLRAVSTAVSVPVIASGGAGSASHVAAAFTAGADAALLAGALHDGTLRIADIKDAVRDAGLPVRNA